MCHSLNTKNIPPPFSQHTLLTYVKGWEHTILSKMDVAAWDQSTHLLFVQLFFSSPESRGVEETRGFENVLQVS